MKARISWNAAAKIFSLNRWRSTPQIRYIIKCDEVVKDKAGNVVELRCTSIWE